MFYRKITALKISMLFAKICYKEYNSFALAGKYDVHFLFKRHIPYTATITH